jgi:hypothetical protein
MITVDILEEEITVIVNADEDIVVYSANNYSTTPTTVTPTPSSPGYLLLTDPTRFQCYHNFIQYFTNSKEGESAPLAIDYSGNSRAMVSPVTGVDFGTAQYPTVGKLNFQGQEISVLKTLSTTLVKQVLVSNGWTVKTLFQGDFEIWMTIAFEKALANGDQFLGLTDFTGGIAHASILAQLLGATGIFDSYYYAEGNFKQYTKSAFFPVNNVGLSLLRIKYKLPPAPDVKSYFNGIEMGGTITTGGVINPAQFLTSLKYALGANYQNYDIGTYAQGPIYPNPSGGYIYFGKHAISNGLLTDTEAEYVAQSLMNPNE